VFGAILQKALIDAGTLGNQVLASPAPILSQIITNQLANASGLAGCVGELHLECGQLSGKTTFRNKSSWD